ncbi:MAG: ABC transporter permease [Candidatus Sumerlaeota bacterium]|nr:ABC transporter permease [Candidatus Sumerlaeota bacterium]
MPETTTNSYNTEAIPITRVRAAKGWAALDWAELWRYRELFGFMVWRDLKVRYKQTALGFAWAIIGPVVNTLIFAFIFGSLAKLSSDGLPPLVFYMIGIVAWRYFSNALTAASGSLVGNQALLTKIYMPRLLIPASTIATSLVDFAIAFILVIVFMLYFHTAPAWTSVFAPLLVVMMMGVALGVGTFFAALNVRFRDVRELVPFLTQIWMYCTIIIPFSEIERICADKNWGAWKYLYGLNPMAGVVEGIRWLLAHHAMKPAPPAPWELIGIGLAVTVALIIAGLYYFRRVEQQFADIV